MSQSQPRESRHYAPSGTSSRGRGRREMAKRIKAARELGDLKENAEYHIAKNDQARLETRIKQLRERLGRAVVVEADTSANAFAFGRTAEIKDVESGQTTAWTLVGATKTDVWQGRALGGVASGAGTAGCAGRRRRQVRDAGRREDLPGRGALG